MQVKVLDLDGTLIDPSQPSLKEREILVNHLSPNDVPLVEHAEKQVLENPFDFPWKYQNRNAAFAEDSYQWRSAQVGYLWDKIQKNTKKDIQTFTTDLYREAIGEEEIQLMPNAKEFVAELLEKGDKVVIVTNSNPIKGQKCSK